MSLRLAIGVWTLALVLASGCAYVIVTSEHERYAGATAALSTALALAFVGGGLIAASRRRENRTGLLMVGVGFAWFLASLRAADTPPLFTIGLALSALMFAGYGHLILAFPDGHLRGRLDRAIVGGAYAVALVLQPLTLLFDRDPAPADCGDDCPDNLMLIDDSGPLAAVTATALRATAVVLVGLALAVLTRRWREATPPARRALAPVLATSTVSLLLIAGFLVAWSISRRAGDLIYLAALASLTAVPLAFVAGLFRSMLARASVPQMLLATPDEPTTEEAETALQHTLGDPTLRLLLWDGEFRQYVDADRRPFDLPEETETCVTTKIEYEGRPLAAIVHDAAVRRNEPELLDEVIAAARVALEKDRAMRRLRASEARNRALLDAIPDAMIRLRADGTCLDINSPDDRPLVAPVDAQIGRDIRELLPAQVADRIVEAVGRAVESGSVTDIEYPLDVGGRIRYFEGRVSPIAHDEAVLIARDVTDRRRQERALVRSEERTRALLDAIPDLMFRIARDGTYLDYKADHAGQLATAPGEVLGRTVRKRLPAEVADTIMAGIEHALADGTIRTIEYELDFTGEPRAYEGRIVRSGDDEVVLIVRDVTERKRHAEALERQRDFLDAVAEATPSLLCLVDEDGRVTERGVNKAFERALGYDPAAVGGYRFWDRFVPPDERNEVRERFEATVAGSAPIEYDNHWLRSDGKSVRVAWTCTPLPRVDDRRLFLLSGVDITERTRQEQEIRASRARLVEAGDAERRRLERNLHDGAQQRLVAHSLALRLARSRLRSDPDSAEQLLDGSLEELTRALEELRELARGIHPAILTDRGLDAALQAVAARSPVPVELTPLGERLPPPVEAAAYYVVSEALANVVKYAQATQVAVSVTRSNGEAVVEVRDDGRGGADPGRGSGLRGLADRVEALNGRLGVESTPGAGTVVRAEIPLGQDDGRA